MAKVINRFLSNTFDHLIKLKMSLRYFPNPSADYTGQEGEGIVPKKFLEDFILEIERDILKHVKPVPENAEDGIYLGTAGISYMFYHLSKNVHLEQRRTKFLKEAAEYLLPTLNYVQKSTVHNQDLPSFILGHSGIYAVGAVIFAALHNEKDSKIFQRKYFELASICKQPNFLSCGSDELFVGRAGYLMGALWMAKEMSIQMPMDDLYAISDLIVASGRHYASVSNSPCPLMYAYYNVEYLGAAHGLCSILQALLSVPDYLEARPTYVRDIKLSVDYLFSLQDKDGNFPTALDEIGQSNELVHWCHGAGGMIYLMAKAYLVWKDEKYFNSCKKMCDLIWRKGLLKKGPGICHGIAGNAYAFLLMFRLTKEHKYLHRAICFARFLKSNEFGVKARIPDHPFSLYEGIAGTACFLADLMEPSNAVFPFSDIFE